MVSLVEEAWLLVLLAVIVSLVLFPMVFFMSFVYDWLAKKYPKTPKILFMLLCTFIATLAILVVVELAAGSVIFETAGTLAR